MTVNELIKILDKEENKYGGLTGKERELYISINGEFLGSIENAKLNGWGDGLITDVTLELQCEKEIRSKTIDEFASTLIPRLTDAIYQKDVESMTNLINEIAEQLKAGGENE